MALIVVLDATAGQGQDKSVEQPKRQLICVANTHIHANPELNDVKLWQVRSLSPGKGIQEMPERYGIAQLSVRSFSGVCLHHSLEPR